MRVRAALSVASIFLSLATGLAQAQGALPLVVEVPVPRGGTVRIALPQRMCAYPKEVRDRLAAFLSGGSDNLRLMGAAGDCEGVERLMRERTAVVMPSLQIAMLEAQTDPAKRSTPASYRRLCFERFPPSGDAMGSDTVVKALKDADRRLELGGEVSLGLLAATREAVFGGLQIRISRGLDRLRLIEVVACFAPGGVPLLWTFQDVVNDGTSSDDMAEKVRSLLRLAQFQAKSTVELNQKK